MNLGLGEKRKEENSNSFKLSLLLTNFNVCSWIDALIKFHTNRILNYRKLHIYECVVKFFLKTIFQI